MKTTEIKAGDWVSHNNKPIKVESVDTPFIFILDETRTLTEVYEEDINPLPLTTEILKKNGWKKDRDNNYIDYDHHLVLCEKSNGYALYKVINGNIIWLMNIDYVHQLQHLLWALEIEDDLKI